MAERALKCPQCNAPLAASRFARTATCPFCGSTVVLGEQTVPASRFRDAFRAWNSPESHGFSEWVSLGDRHWALGPLIARGEVSDVYAAARARWPTERALLKILRDPRDASAFDHEWEVLVALQRSEAPGAESFAARLPEPVAHGEITAGAREGDRAMVLRWASGFAHTFEDARRAYPQGIEPRASIWIWRRILEALAFVHASGFVHGAVLPPHLLVEEGEHGVRLVGFRAAGRPGEPLRASPGFEPFYPQEALAAGRLTPEADLAMAARCVAALLGGDPASGEVPGRVPAPLAREVAAAGALRPASGGEAWRLHKHLGELAREVFGPPVFCPLRLPREA
ncbi:MAG: hypothetical protein ACJ76N_29450 [Thermoanaerobaculia bacterium]